MTGRFATGFAIGCAGPIVAIVVPLLRLGGVPEIEWGLVPPLLLMPLFLLLLCVWAFAWPAVAGAYASSRAPGAAGVIGMTLSFVPWLVADLPGPMTATPSAPSVWATAGGRRATGAYRS
jgi:hypothetical protein